MRAFIIGCSWLLLMAAAAHGNPEEPLGVGMEGFPYPHPVQWLALRMEGEDVRMGYMDVPPAGAANGRSVVLLHGRNFFGAYWARPSTR